MAHVRHLSSTVVLSPQAYDHATNQHWLSVTHASTDECSTMEPRQHVAIEQDWQDVAMKIHGGTSPQIDSTTRCNEQLSSMVEQLPTTCR